MVNKHFELYATKDRIIALTDPTRIRIMHFIADSEKEFEEITLYVGKAKSTISSHLDRLELNELISSRKDSKDQRKKLYKSTAKLIGISSKHEPVVYIVSPEHYNTLNGKD